MTRPRPPHPQVNDSLAPARILVPLEDQEKVSLRQAIGHRCRRARRHLGISRRALAEAMGRSPSWVREIEGGRQYAPPYLLLPLANATGVSVGWFYGEEGPDPRRLAEQILEAVRQKLPSQLPDSLAPEND